MAQIINPAMARRINRMMIITAMVIFRFIVEVMWSTVGLVTARGEKEFKQTQVPARPAHSQI